MTTATDHSFSRKWLAALAAGSIALSGLFGLATPAAAEEVPTDETVQVVEAPTQEIVVEEAPAGDAPAEEASTDEVPAEEAAVEEAPIVDAPAETQEAPAENLVIEAPAETQTVLAARAAPQVTVSPATDVDTTVSNTFTVSGTDFVGDGAANGVYVLLGPASTWSGGTPLPGEGWVAQTHVPASSFTDGAFTGTLTVPAGTLDPAVSYVVATSAAHWLSATNRTLDTITPIALKPAVVPPAVVVSPATNIDTTVANTLTVTGSNFVGAGAAGGVYVLVGPASNWDGTGALPGSGWTAQVWVRANELTEGKWTASVPIAAGTLDPAASYVVVTSSTGRLSATDRSMDTFTPITLKPAVVPPAVTVNPATDIDTTVANTLTVTGSNFVGAGAAGGVYVLVGPVSNWDGTGALPGSGWTAQVWVRANELTDGKWTASVPIAAGKLDPSVSYVVVTSSTGRLSATDRSMDTFTPITLKPAVAAPQVTVSPATNIDTTVANTLTVTGSNFVGAGAAGGVYVLVGPSSNWDGTGALPGSGWTEQVWVRANELTDGKWTASVPIAAGKLDPAVSYVVVTSSTGRLSATDRSMDTFTLIALKPAVVAPKVTVSPATNIDTTVANTLSVAGTNFVGPGAANGAYVLLGPATTWSGGTPLPGAGWTAQIYVPASAIVNGSFTGALNVPAGTLDPAVSYVVATSAAHGLSVSNRSLDTITPISLKPVVVVPDAPRVTVSPSTNIDTTVANALTVSGTNFVGPGAANGAYVLLGPASTWSGGTPLPGEGWTAQIHVPASSIVNGAFTGTLNVPAGTLDPSVSYIVATSAAHGLSVSNRTLDTTTRISLKPVTVPNPNPTLTLGVAPSSLNATIENTVTVTGSGYTGPGAANGVYVNFGAASTWQPGQVPGAGSWVVSQHIPASSVVNGSFTTTLTIPANTLVAGQNYGVATFAAHALSVTNRTLDKWTPVVVLNPGTPTTPTEPTNPTNPTTPTTPTTPTNPTEPPNPNPSLGLGVNPSTVDATVDNVLTVTGSGYTGPGAANGVYVNLGALSVWQPGEVPGDGAWIASVHVPASKIVNGEWTTTLVIPANSLVAGERYGVATFAAHQLSLTNRTLDKWTEVTVTNPVAPTNPSNPTTPTNPGTPTTPTNPSNPTTPAGASLSLGVNPSSVNAGVANTFTISGSGYTGAGAANGVYVNIGSSSVWQPGQVPGEGSWIASRHIPSSGIVNGSWSISITVPANTFTSGESYGAATFAAHALSITNRSLDAWAPISLGGAITTASAVQQLVTTPAETPPATTGITVIGAPVAGQKLSAEAQGFQPSEKGILVVLYSDPIVLGTVDADADGVARWSGNLPFGLSGKHTLTFQGSINQGAEIEIAAAEVAGCPVDGATLSWGFKETFRSYISGSIANGEWVVANGASYETPAFGWNNGVGGYDPETGEGHIGFTGSIQFTGHSGALNTTVANPQIKFVDSDTAMLLLDVTGVTQTGETINELGVEFVELDVSGAELADGVLTIADASAVLTEAGAAAFGTYPAGEAFDAVSLSIPLADCGEQVVASPEAEEQDGGTVEVTSADAPNLWWILWVALALLLAVLIVRIVIGARRRGNATK